MTVAFVLKYLGHDVLTAGVHTNSSETLELLQNWADRVIITEQGQLPDDTPKMQLWNIGEDRYPRPFHPGLLNRCRRLLDEHREEYDLKKNMV